MHTHLQQAGLAPADAQPRQGRGGGALRQQRLRVIQGIMLLLLLLQLLLMLPLLLLLLLLLLLMLLLLLLLLLVCSQAWRAVAATAANAPGD